MRNILKLALISSLLFIPYMPALAASPTVQLHFINQQTYTGSEVPARIGYLNTSYNLAEIVQSGFLNDYVQAQGITVLPTDVFVVVAADGTQWYKPVIDKNGFITLAVLP